MRSSIKAGAHSVRHHRSVRTTSTTCPPRCCSSITSDPSSHTPHFPVTLERAKRVHPPVRLSLSEMASKTTAPANASSRQNSSSDAVLKPGCCMEAHGRVCPSVTDQKLRGTSCTCSTESPSVTVANSGEGSASPGLPTGTAYLATCAAVTARPSRKGAKKQLRRAPRGHLASRKSLELTPHYVRFGKPYNLGDIRRIVRKAGIPHWWAPGFERVSCNVCKNSLCPFS